MNRENFVNLPEQVCRTFAELAAAMGVSKKKLFCQLVMQEATRRKELLEIHRQQQELERRAKSLRD